MAAAFITGSRLGTQCYAQVQHHLSAPIMFALILAAALLDHENLFSLSHKSRTFYCHATNFSVFCFLALSLSLSLVSLLFVSVHYLHVFAFMLVSL